MQSSDILNYKVPELRNFAKYLNNENKTLIATKFIEAANILEEAGQLLYDDEKLEWDKLYKYKFND